MADGIDLNALADLVKNKTPEEIKKMFDELANNTTAAVAKYNISLSKMVDITKEKTKNVADATRAGVDNIKEEWKNLELSSFVQTISSQITDLTAAMGINFQSLIKGGTAVADLALSYKTLSTLPQTNIFESLNRNLADTDRSSAETATGFKELLNTFGIQPEKSAIASALLQNLEAADRIKQVEQSFIQTAAATGQLNEVFNESGDSINNVQNKLNEYRKIVEDTSSATGLNARQVDNWAASLMNIPGALSASVMPSSETGESIGVLNAALTAATGSGARFTDVFAEISRQYARFGQDTGDGFKDSLEYVVSLQKATNDLRIPLEYVRNFTDNASESFKFFGNNSQAAINIISRLGPALKESGLGPSAISAMTQDITENISRMDLASRSFLSQQTGGAGGLRGGYEIELLKSQGKIDEIQKKMEDSLRKQFGGGPIVTLEQAAQDENAARQLTKQVQLVMSGPTKMVNSEAEAYKLFEAMAKGIKSPEKITPENVLNESMERGNQIQLRNNNLLNDAVRLQQSIAASTELMASNTVRGVFGPGESRNAQAEMMRNSMRQGDLSTGQRDIFKDSQQTSATDDFARFVEGLNLSQDGFKEMFSNEGVAGFFKAGLEKAKNFEIDSGSLSNGLIGGLARGVGQGNFLDEIPAMVNRENNRENIQTSTKGDTATVNVSATCPECQKKIMEDTALTIVDGKIVQSKKGELQHIHTGFNSSF